MRAFQTHICVSKHVQKLLYYDGQVFYGLSVFLLPIIQKFFAAFFQKSA